MQDELRSEYPDKPFQIVGVNEFGHESGNTLMASEGDAPILQDVDANSNGASDVWRDDWDVTYRDVKIVNQQNELVGTVNLTPPEGFNLAEQENYDALKQVLVDVAHERPHWQNPVDPTDVNNDQRTSAVDAIQCINELMLGTVSGSGIDLPLPMPPKMPTPYLDVNGDGRITASDAIRVINRLIEQSSGTEGELVASSSQPAVAEGEAVSVQAFPSSLSRPKLVGAIVDQAGEHDGYIVLERGDLVSESGNDPARDKDDATVGVASVLSASIVDRIFESADELATRSSSI